MALLNNQMKTTLLGIEIESLKVMHLDVQQC